MSQSPSLSKTIESLVLRTRNIDDVELEKFYDKILKSTTEIDNLRQLMLTLFFSSSDRWLPNEVVNALLATVCDEKTPPRIVNLCVLVLSEVSPLSLQLNDITCILGKKSLMQLLPLLPLQKKNVWTKTELIPQLLKNLQNPKITLDHMTVLIFINKFISSEDFLSSNDADCLNNRFTDFLSKTSIYQASNPYSSMLFRKSELNELALELDGNPIQDNFTILNLAQYNTEDQFVNICSFSIMRNWLSCSIAQGKTYLNSPIFKKLVQIVRDYCVRVIDQSSYVTQNVNDKELQKASLVEAISILDLICTFEPTHTVTVFSCIKRVNSKLSDELHTDAQASVVFISVLQFLLHHGSIVAFDVEDILRNFFTTHISLYYWNIGAAFEYVQFFLDNKTVLSEKFTSFTKYFPSMMKILAWYPKSFLENFAELLPMFICENTAIEVFHLLLDFPCLTASLIVSQHSTNEASQAVTPVLYTLQQTLKDPLFKPMLSFMMRSSSGVGDTFNKLKLFHEAMECISEDARIVTCSELVPVFLKLYFDSVLKNCSMKTLIDLLPIILERVNQLYNVSGFKPAIHKVLGEQIINVSKVYPSLAIDVRSELMEYLNHMHNIQEGPLFYMNMVWLVGTYTSANFHPQCTPKIITSYYEIIECISYETLVSLNTLPFAVKLVTIIATTLAKLATRCQDLIPRAKLCLAKINHCISKSSSQFKEEETEVLAERIEELLSILRCPNVASIVLNPPSNLEDCKWHQDEMSVPFVLKSISTLFD